MKGASDDSAVTTLALKMESDLLLNRDQFGRYVIHAIRDLILEHIVEVGTRVLYAHANYRFEWSETL